MKNNLKKIISYLEENIKEYFFEITKITETRWQYICGFGNKEKIFYFNYKFKINNNFGVILHTNQILEGKTLNFLKEELKWLDIRNGQILDIEKQLKMLREEEFFRN